MIQQQTVLKVIDNSGAKTVKCIKVLGGFKRKFAYLGDTIVVSVQDTKKFSNIQKGVIYHALIIRTKKIIQQKDGSAFFLFENAVSLIKPGKTAEPLANRIFGPISKKLIKNFPDFAKISGEIF
jgi:large subunit ribosomal protein L14